MVVSRKKYSKEFKMKAVELLEQSSLTTKEIADDLGIHINMLYRWRSKAIAKQQEPFPGNGKLSPDDEQLKRMQQELNDLKMERDILKKALGIFSRTSK